MKNQMVIMGPEKSFFISVVADEKVQEKVVKEDIWRKSSPPENLQQNGQKLT